MKNKNIKILALIAMAYLGCVIAGTNAFGESIVITNPSFEASAVPDGQTWGVNGWIIGASSSTWGVNNPTSANYANATGDLTPLPTPADGHKILAGFNNGGLYDISQTLSATYDSGNIYTLSVAVGAPLGNPFSGARIELYAGETLLASSSLDYNAVTKGTFVDLTATSIAGSALAANGSALRIVLYSVYDGIHASTRSDFDNVRLTAMAAIPEPSSYAFTISLLVFCGVAARRPRG